MLFASETFFLGGSNDRVVVQQSRGAVVIKGGDTQDSQDSENTSEQRIDERGDCRTLRQHNQTPKEDHHDQQWQQPVLLSDSKEFPEFSNERHESLP
jgi:hypothetical protein